MTEPPDTTFIGEEPVVVRAEEHDERYWSVTTIIGALDKPALVPWAAIKTAEAAVDQHDVWWSRYEHEGRKSAVDYLKGARFKTKGKRTATALGTAVHKACEHKAIYGSWRPEDTADPDLRPFLVQFDKFLDQFQPSYLAAEVTVFSPTWGYAGTCDGFLLVDGVPLIIDYKTSAEDLDGQGDPKSPYPEVALQLAAYRYADIAAVWRARQVEQFKRRYYLLSPSERALGQPVPEVDGGVAIFITPERYGVYPVRCDEEIFDLFLHLIDVARFSFDLGKNVIGNPMIPPRALTLVDDDPFAGLPQE